MNRKHFLVIVAILVLTAMAIVPVVSLADAGNFVGDSNWGSSSWGGSSSDWGSSSWGSSGSDWDYDSSYGSGTGFGTGLLLGSCAGGGGGISVTTVIIIAVVLVIAAIGLLKKKKGTSSDTRQDTRPRNTDISKLREADPAFSEQDFLEKTRNLYVRVQNAWTAKDMEPVRSELSGPMYAQFERQLMPFKNNNQTNYVDRIAVMAADIVDYRQDSVNDILTVRLQTRIVDYIKDDVTGQILRGSENRELFMTYEWTFIRTKGKVTPLEDGEKRSTCPSCGAPVDLNHTSKCEYCGAVLSASDYDWVLNAVKGISQRSN